MGDRLDLNTLVVCASSWSCYAILNTTRAVDAPDLAILIRLAQLCFLALMHVVNPNHRKNSLVPIYASGCVLITEIAY